MSSEVIVDEYIDNNYENFCFESLSTGKLVFLSLITLGIYECIWFYHIWKHIKVKSNVNISPFWRAVFAGISAFWLFPVLNKYFTKFNKCYSFNPILFAILYLFINILVKLPNPYWILCFGSIVILVAIQSKINYINANYFPESPTNKWNLANTLWTIPCIIFFIFTIIGTLLPG